MITPNYQASIEFLQRWLPRGPWVLVAIDPNKKGLEADTFGGIDVNERLPAWLDKQGTKLKRNIYFTVNPCTRHLTTKPSREHIAGLSWLHVDLDPRAGEDLAEERKRILALLGDPSALGIPKPTVIVFSGGGYQGFWRLKIPQALDGTAEQYEDAKRWNKQLELVLGGDNCHNVDRIMRLPGTVNRPDARKRAKGRVDVLAEVVEFNDELHDLAKFTKAQEVQGSSLGFSGRTVEVSGNVARFSSVDDIDELKDKRWSQCRVVIVQGHDPDDPDKFKGSRSEWLFFVCCEMVRAGCSDDAIYAVITDPDFGISASVLDKGSGIEEYAVRQIERAREEAVDPILRELNDKHAVIGSMGSKGLCRVLGELYDPVLERHKIAFQSQSDFTMFYRNRKREWIDNDGKAQSMPAAIWWLEHPLRRQYNNVVFAPGKQVPATSYNLWKGFAVSADPSGSCELYLRHVKQNICADNEEHYEYLLNWMANAVQKPYEPGQVAVVLKGDPGTGKGVFATGFGHLWGRHFSHIADSTHLVGQFTGHTRECVVMYADEAVASDDARAESKLKALVTESTIVTESKGVDAEPTPNYIHLIMASNAKWVVPVGAHDRRYFVLDVKPSKRQDSAYFSALQDELEAGGYEALLAMLLARDLSQFNVRNKPNTDSMRREQEQSLSPDDEWWYGKLYDGEVIIGEGWSGDVYCETLLYDFDMAMMKNKGGRVSAIRLRKLLDYVTCGQVERLQLKPPTPVNVVHRDGHVREVARPYVYRLPSLESCRLLWSSLGKPAMWPKEATEAAPTTYDEVGPDE